MGHPLQGEAAGEAEAAMGAESLSSPAPQDQTLAGALPEGNDHHSLSPFKGEDLPTSASEGSPREKDTAQELLLPEPKVDTSKPRKDLQTIRQLARAPASGVNLMPRIGLPCLNTLLCSAVLTTLHCLGRESTGTRFLGGGLWEGLSLYPELLTPVPGLVAEADPYAIEFKFPCAFCHFGPDVLGLYFFQASDAAAESAVSVKGVGKDVKDKTEEMKEPPTSVPASRNHRQVKRLMPAWSPLQDALPILAVHPMGCSF